MKRFNAIVLKEFFHILRDRRSLIIIFALPVMMIFFYGYSISFDLKRIDTGVIDLKASESSREFMARFAHNRYYVIHPIAPGRGDLSLFAMAEHMLLEGKIKQYIILPANFSEKIRSDRPAEVGFVIDGSDSNIANLVYQYNQQIVFQYLLDSKKMKNLVRISTQLFFNPEGKSSFFFIPGLVGVLLLMISALLTSISIAREKETGSIDLLFISPLRSSEIILGKTMPYVVVAMIMASMVMLFSHYWFGIPIRGNLIALVLFSFIYVFCGLSFGILVSTIASSQRIAMMAALLTTMLPSLLLSGFIFPLSSLPLWLQGISYMIPATYFLRIIRGVVVKGAPLKSFLFEGGMLVLLSAVLVNAANRRFTRLRRKAR